MGSSDRYLSPSEAARRLGVSAKALRLYERRGLIAPLRTAAGWRAYGPDQMGRASEVAALRALGLSLAEVARVLEGEARGLESALAAHQSTLEARLREVAQTIDRVRAIRDDLAQGKAPTAPQLAGLLAPHAGPAVAFDLPWPGGGERFELGEMRPLTYITGPLGSGKTRLARRLAEALPGAVFVGLQRLDDGAAAARARLVADPALRARAEAALAWLAEDGAAISDALVALVEAIEADGPAALVIDVVEQGLEQAAQEAVIAWLRRRGPGARPLFLLTRSCAILDPPATGPDEAIVLCPANHSPPFRVTARPGAYGYEALETCLASPEVRARVARPPEAA